MLNMGDKDLQFLEGTNLGLSSSNIKCGQSANNNGLVDLGRKFEMITDETTTYDRKDNSIRMQVHDICDGGTPGK